MDDAGVELELQAAQEAVAALHRRLATIAAAKSRIDARIAREDMLFVKDMRLKGPAENVVSKHKTSAIVPVDQGGVGIGSSHSIDSFASTEHHAQSGHTVAVAEPAADRAAVPSVRLPSSATGTTSGISSTLRRKATLVASNLLDSHRSPRRVTMRHTFFFAAPTPDTTVQRAHTASSMHAVRRGARRRRQRYMAAQARYVRAAGADGDERCESGAEAGAGSVSGNGTNAHVESAQSTTANLQEDAQDGTQNYTVCMSTTPATVRNGQRRRRVRVDFATLAQYTSARKAAADRGREQPARAAPAPKSAPAGGRASSHAKNTSGGGGGADRGGTADCTASEQRTTGHFRVDFAAVVQTKSRPALRRSTPHRHKTAPGRGSRRRGRSGDGKHQTSMRPHCHRTFAHSIAQRQAEFQAKAQDDQSKGKSRSRFNGPRRQGTTMSPALIAKILKYRQERKRRLVARQPKQGSDEKIGKQESSKESDQSQRGVG